MPRRCSVCSRPDAGSINALLMEGRSARSVALDVGVSDDVMQRHASGHLSRSVAATQRPPTDAPPALRDPIDELVEALRPRALTGDPQVAHQYRLALAAQAEARNAAPQARALATEPEWLALRSRLMAALEPHPDATRAVIVALGGLA